VQVLCEVSRDGFPAYCSHMGVRDGTDPRDHGHGAFFGIAFSADASSGRAFLVRCVLSFTLFWIYMMAGVEIVPSFKRSWSFGGGRLCQLLCLDSLLDLALRRLCASAKKTVREALKILHRSSYCGRPVPFPYHRFCLQQSVWD
jgi:hypothetical protein